eukprot:595682-Prymnesium_polylepis.3
MNKHSQFGWTEKWRSADPLEAAVAVVVVPLSVAFQIAVFAIETVPHVVEAAVAVGSTAAEVAGTAAGAMGSVLNAAGDAAVAVGEFGSNPMAVGTTVAETAGGV